MFHLLHKVLDLGQHILTLLFDPLLELQIQRSQLSFSFVLQTLQSTWNFSIELHISGSSFPDHQWSLQMKMYGRNYLLLRRLVDVMLDQFEGDIDDFLFGAHIPESIEMAL